MITVGIDPGSKVTGFVALQAAKKNYNVVRAVKVEIAGTQSKPLRVVPSRLHDMTTKVMAEISEVMRLGFPADIAIEEPFVGPQGPSALLQHAVFSAVAFEVYKMFGRVRTVSPSTVKSFVGAKQKQFVARQVYKRWGFESNDDNVVDAFAIAMWAAENA